MTYANIYAAALRLICEGANSIDSDYEERAPYLLGTFITEQIPLQKKWDQAYGREVEGYEPCLFVSMSDSFPLVDAFITPATYYLAAMLALDENETLSDHLYDHYVDGIASIECSLPAKQEKITDRYHALN